MKELLYNYSNNDFLILGSMKMKQQISIKESGTKRRVKGKILLNGSKLVL